MKKRRNVITLNKQPVPGTGCARDTDTITAAAVILFVSPERVNNVAMEWPSAQAVQVFREMLVQFP
jgi:hypothetical protein